VLLGAIPASEGQPAQQGALSHARRRGVSSRRSGPRSRDELDAPFVSVIRARSRTRTSTATGYWDLVRQRRRRPASR
jgi:hypothetical protein